MPDGERVCTLCSECKPIAEFFFINRRKGDQRHSRCKKCRRSQHKVWRETPRGREVKRAGILVRDYGITEAEYNAMLDEQGGACAICKRPETKRHRNGVVCRLSVDHEHGTRIVRGLLCSKCNVGLGSFEDDPAALVSAAAYLNRSGKS